MPKLITVGDLVFDTHVQIDNAKLEYKENGRPNKICLEYGSKIPIKDSFQSIGGNATNVAMGTNLLGVKTAIISTLGNDANGKTVLADLKKHGINTEHITVDNKITSRYSIILNYKGERTILSYHQKINYLWPKKMPTDIEWIYFTSLSEGYKNLQTSMLKYLNKNPHIKLIYNPGSYQLKYDLSEIRKILHKTEILIVNVEEAEMILKIEPNKTKDPTEILQSLLLLGVKEVVLTDADNGAYAGNYEGIWKINKFPVKVISKTGAGDAFSAGYVSAKVLGHDLEKSLLWGVANGGSVITKPGAQNGLLNQLTLKKMLNKHKNILPKKIK